MYISENSLIFTALIYLLILVAIEQFGEKIPIH